MFNPELFAAKSAKPEAVEQLFNGPVTGGKKLPQVKRAKKFLAEDVWLVGYPAKRGCFSFRPYVSYDGRKMVDVGFMDCEPNNLSLEAVNNAEFLEFEVIPGWGFPVMGKLKQWLAKV